MAKMGLVSLITGIAAYIIFCIGPILAIVAIITGFMGRGEKDQKTMATIGLILGIAYFILAIVGFILRVILGVAFAVF